MIDWDEFVDDQSGRKFYYNTLTKEKSWKPPRKTRGSIGEGKFYAFIKEFFKYLIKVGNYQLFYLIWRCLKFQAETVLMQVQICMKIHVTV